MNAIKNVVTGGAYDKPAVTKDGAMTTQDNPNAHTTKDTSADPNYEPSTKLADMAQDKIEQAKNAPGQDKAVDMAKQAQSKKQEMQQ